MPLSLNLRQIIGGILRFGFDFAQIKGLSSSLLAARDNIDSANARFQVADPSVSADALNLGYHEIIDSLVHDLAESCYTVPTYNGSGQITAMTVWDSPAMLIKVREVVVTYNGSGQVATSVTTQHDGAGAIIQTLTETYAYNGAGLLFNVTTVETLCLAD